MRLVAVTLFFVCLPCQAYFFTGNALVGNMRAWQAVLRGDNDGAAGYNAGTYVGYVVGEYDVLVSQQAICPDEEHVNIAQVSAIVEKFLEENPEIWNRPARDLVAMALTSAFPCETPSAN